MMDRSRDDVSRLHGVPEGPLGADRLDQTSGKGKQGMKRRADVIGIFADDAAVVRLVGALMLEQNDRVAVFSPLHDAGNDRLVSRDPVVSLPALAA